MDSPRHALGPLPNGQGSEQAGATEGLEATVAEAQRQLQVQVARAVLDATPDQALLGALDALVQFALARPHTAQLLMGEAMVSGPALQRLRAEGIEEIAAMIERAYRYAPTHTLAPDLPCASAIGGVYRLLDSMLHREEPLRAELSEELAKWLASYTRPLAQHRWHPLRPLSPAPVLPAPPAPEPAPAEIELDAREPATAEARASDPDGVSAGELAARERQRILLATAEVTARAGYGGASEASISAAAGIDEATFHRHFPEKRAAFRAAHELHYRQAMTSAAGAFFAGESWPQRIWLAGAAFAGYMQANPALLRASLVEGYAGGPPTLQRGEDIVAAFTIFLQEGYQHLDGRERPSRLTLIAIGATIFEIGYDAARASPEPKIAGLLPYGVYVCLAPFLGPDATDALIDAQLRAV